MTKTVSKLGEEGKVAIRCVCACVFVLDAGIVLQVPSRPPLYHLASLHPRNVRRDSMKAIEKLEKDGAVGEDERKSLEGAVQKLTDEYIKEVDGLIKSKQDELSKV